MHIHVVTLNYYSSDDFMHAVHRKHVKVFCIKNVELSLDGEVFTLSINIKFMDKVQISLIMYKTNASLFFSSNRSSKLFSTVKECVPYD